MTGPIEALPGPQTPDAGLLDWLAGRGVNYELHEDPRNPAAAAAAARVHGVRLICTAIVLTEGEEPALLVVRDGDLLDLAKAARVLCTPAARVASNEMRCARWPLVALPAPCPRSGTSWVFRFAPTAPSRTIAKSPFGRAAWSGRFDWTGLPGRRSRA